MLTLTDEVNKFSLHRLKEAQVCLRGPLFGAVQEGLSGTINIVTIEGKYNIATMEVVCMELLLQPCQQEGHALSNPDNKSD